MPRGDRTGPEGRGPRTGRALGFCNGYNFPGYMNQRFGRGQGLGRRAYWNESVDYPRQEYKEPTKEEFLKELEAEKADLEKTIKELKKEKK